MYVLYAGKHLSLDRDIVSIEGIMQKLEQLDADKYLSCLTFNAFMSFKNGKRNPNTKYCSCLTKTERFQTQEGVDRRDKSNSEGKSRCGSHRVFGP